MAKGRENMQKARFIIRMLQAGRRLKHNIFRTGPLGGNGGKGVTQLGKYSREENQFLIGQILGDGDTQCRYG
jgi:hypothetical protein